MIDRQDSDADVQLLAPTAAAAFSIRRRMT
jgi:hypothetical protein